MTFPKVGYLMRPLATSSTIKNTVELEQVEGLFPGYSASGQDVWLSYYDYDGPAIVLSAVGAQCGKTFLADNKWGTVANTAALAIDTTKSSPKFLHYMTNQKDFWEKGGSAQPYVKVSETLRKRFFIPDLATQRQIADFLDRETARIDLLIEKKQRLVALLGERQEVRVEEELNRVDPAYVHRLKFAIRRIEQGWSPQCEDACVEGEKWGVLKLGAITTGVYREEQHKTLPETIEPIPSLRVQVGDVLVARASGSPKLVGKAAFVETANLNLMLSDKHFRLAPNLRKVLPEYLAIVVNSGKSRSQIEDRLSSAEGMARNIGQSVIYGLRCPFPPLEMQRKILNAVRSSKATTDALVSKTNASIDRLKEYRSALITAAVTGQIDVQSYAKSGTADLQFDTIQKEMET